MRERRRGGARIGGRGEEYLRIAADIMLICERGCMPDKPAVPRYISPLLPAVKPRGPTPSFSRTCTLLNRCECVRALHYVTLPFRTPPLSSFNENLEERLVVSRGLEMRVLAP